MGVRDGETIGDENVLFRESIKFKRKKKLMDGKVKVSINSSALTVCGRTGEISFPLDEITALTMVGKKKFNFYHNGRILQIKGDKRFCAIKYVHIFEGLRKAAKNKK